MDNTIQNSTDVESNIRKELEKQYNHKYNALKDGHTNMCIRTNCMMKHLKYLSNLNNIQRETIDQEIKCPKISTDNLKDYLEHYGKLPIFGCKDCGAGGNSNTIGDRKANPAESIKSHIWW